MNSCLVYLKLFWRYRKRYEHLTMKCVKLWGIVFIVVGTLPSQNEGMGGVSILSVFSTWNAFYLSTSPPHLTHYCSYFGSQVVFLSPPWATSPCQQSPELRGIPQWTDAGLPRPSPRDIQSEIYFRPNLETVTTWLCPIAGTLGKLLDAIINVFHKRFSGPWFHRWLLLFFMLAVHEPQMLQDWYIIKLLFL